MKALTICQPYAELILRGDKRVENRKWNTRYRGPLLIHAGKSRDWLDLVPAPYEPRLGLLPYDSRYGIRLQEMAFGAIVGRVEVIDCLPVSEILSGTHDEQYPWLRAHPHVEGPYCLVLASPVRLAVPIPYRGQLGLFAVPDTLLPASWPAQPLDDRNKQQGGEGVTKGHVEVQDEGRGKDKQSRHTGTPTADRCEGTTVSRPAGGKS